MATIPASENVFPVLRMQEGAAAATPPTGEVHLYVKSDGTLYWKDDAGTEYSVNGAITGLADHLADTSDAHDASAVSVLDTAAVFTATNVETALKELYDAIGAGGIPATIIDAAGDLIIGTAADTAARLAKGSAGQALVSGASTIGWADVLPWHIWVSPQITTPDATTGSWALATGSTDSGFIYPFYTPGSTANSGGASKVDNGAGALNDAWAVDLVLAAGTWDFHCWVRKSTNTGIITLQQDGVDQGTVDTYAAAAAAAKVSITGWTVSTTGKKRMNLKMATKNASSSSYVLTMFAIEFRRTA